MDVGLKVSGSEGCYIVKDIDTSYQWVFNDKSDVLSFICIRREEQEQRRLRREHEFRLRRAKWHLKMYNDAAAEQLKNYMLDRLNNESYLRIYEFANNNVMGEPDEHDDWIWLSIKADFE